MASTSNGAYRDRTTGLILFGILVVVVGMLCAAMVPLTMVVVALSETLEGLGSTPMTWRAAVPGMVLYGALAVVLVWLGMGSVRCRRWAPPLLLVLAWLWLAVGALGLAMTVVIASRLYAEMAVSGMMTTGVALLVQVVTYCVVALLYVVLPGLLVLFYRSGDVEATCRARDPKACWIDEYPSSALSLLVLYVLTAVLLLLTPAYGAVVPFFGLVLTGPVAWLMLVAALAVCLWLTWMTYRLRLSSWWAAVVLVSLVSISALVTFLRVPPADLYRQMHLPPEQLALIHQAGLDGLWVTQGLIVATWASFVVYMLYVRRCFGARARS